MTGLRLAGSRASWHAAYFVFISTLARCGPYQLMLLQLETIASAALAHVDGQHAAYLGLLTPGWLS